MRKSLAIAQLAGGSHSRCCESQLIPQSRVEVIPGRSCMTTEASVWWKGEGHDRIILRLIRENMAPTGS